MASKRKYVERRRWMAQVLGSNLGLTYAEKLAAVAFAEQFSDAVSGRGWPSQETLARAIGAKTKKTAQRALDKLVDVRLLLRHGFSKERTRVYQIPLDRFSDVAEEPPQDPPQNRKPTMGTNSKKGKLTSDQVEENRYRNWLYRLSKLSSTNLMSDKRNANCLRRVHAECSELMLTDEQSAAEVTKALGLR